ncbi:MAG: DUF4288 domain-containing protein [Kangiellaceae bacterium]|jgi:hypothetical protein|nr:DUF4288 domain-containing protein [Kangiellaceae bacterium]
MDYYSVTISVICIIDDGKLPVDGYTQDIQVHIVEANDSGEAKLKAIDIGRAQEHNYKNADGFNVFWKFKEIEYIRKLGKVVTGIEVSTRLESIHYDEVYSSVTNFNPEQSEPITDG